MKKFWIAIASFFLALAVFAADAPGFTAKIIATKAVNIGDQFAGILPGRPPFFPQASKAVCGEPFFVEIVFAGAAVKEGAVSLTGKVTASAPGGKKQVIPLQKRTMKIRGYAAGVCLLPESLRVNFDPRDPKGLHTFELELTDENAKKTAKAVAKVEYVSSVPAAPEEEAMKRIGSYYRSPCPENILPAFRAYLKNLPAQKQKEKRNFNPFPQLALFYFLLKNNPQCIGPFAEMAAKLPDQEGKRLAAVVLNFVSPEAAKKIPAETKQELDRRIPVNPFVFAKASAPWQLDICWSEFLVNGTRAPVLKVVNALSLAKDGISIEDFKKIPKPTAEDRRKLFNHVTAAAAQWSLSSLAQHHPLIRYYVEAALRRKEIPDPVAAAIAAKSIGMQVRVVPPKKETAPAKR